MGRLLLSWYKGRATAHPVEHATSVFFLVFGLLLLSYSGVFRSIDELALYDAVEQLVVFRQPVPSSEMPQLHWAFYGPSAQLGGVGNFEPGLVLLAAPLLALATFGWPSGSMQLLLLLNPIVTAATAALLYLCLARLGYRIRTRIAGIATYLLATQALYYASGFFREPLVGLGLLAATMAAVSLPAARAPSSAPDSRQGKEHAGIGAVAVSGVAIGVALGLSTITKSSTLALVPVFVAVPVARSLGAGLQKRRGVVLALAILASLAAAQAVAGIYGVIAGQGLTGDRPSPSDQLTQASASYVLLLERLFGLIASAGHGVLIYSPIFLLCLPGAVMLWRRSRSLVVLAAGSSASLIALYATYQQWDAGFVWGTRFLVPLMPLWVVLLAPVLESALTRQSRARSLLVGGVVLISALVQIASVSINVYPFLAQFESSRLTDYANAPVLRVVGHWLRTFPLSDTLLWLPNPSVPGSRLDLPTLAIVLVVAIASLSSLFLASRLKIRTWKRTVTAAALLLAVTGLVVPKAINHYGNLLVRYETVEADLLREAAEFIGRNAEPDDAVLGVSYNFQFNLLQSFGPRDVRFYWFSTESYPLEQRTESRLREVADRFQRAWIVLDRVSTVGPESGIEYWLLNRAYKFEEKWFGSYKVAGYDLPRLAADGYATRNVAVGNLAYLDDVRIDSGTVRPGDSVRLEASWHILAEPDVRVMPRLQLVDSAGEIHHFTLDDLQGGLYPSTKWRQGITVADRRSMRLPPSLSPGEYALQVTLVEPDGKRVVAGPSRSFGPIVVAR